MSHLVGPFGLEPDDARQLQAEDAVNDAEQDMVRAWGNLSAELHSACTPGVDIAKLIEAIDEYIVARVVLMKMDV